MLRPKSKTIYAAACVALTSIVIAAGCDRPTAPKSKPSQQNLEVITKRAETNFEPVDLDVLNKAGYLKTENYDQLENAYKKWRNRSIAAFGSSTLDGAFEGMYLMAERIVKDLNYDLEDIEYLFHEATKKPYEGDLQFHASSMAFMAALINYKIKDGQIVRLNIGSSLSPWEIHRLGYRLPRGEIWAQNAGEQAGREMNGGVIKVRTIAGSDTANGATGGKIYSRNMPNISKDIAKNSSIEIHCEKGMVWPR